MNSARCLIIGKPCAVKDCLCENCVNMRKKKQLYKSTHPPKPWRPCLIVGHPGVRKGCQCDNCVFKRKYDAEAHRKWKERDPEGFSVMKKASDRRVIEKKKLLDPDGYRAYRHHHLKKWRSSHYEQWRASLAEKNIQNKRRVITYYGNKCSCCSETAFEFLTIEHINGDGKKDRKGKSGYSFWASIIKRGFPSDLTVLCYNCNCSKGQFGTCPHIHPQ